MIDVPKSRWARTDLARSQERGPELAPSVLDLPHLVVDLAPTIAAWLGVELDDFDGAPIAGLVRPV